METVIDVSVKSSKRRCKPSPAVSGGALGAGSVVACCQHWRAVSRPRLTVVMACCQSSPVDSGDGVLSVESD